MKKGPNDIATIILFDYVVSNLTTLRIKKATNYSHVINIKLSFF